MFFRQVLNEDLGCASYVVADGGEAAVVDPQWDVEPYLRLAREQGFRIAHVLETHNHADHVSGRGRLRSATGAVLHAPKGAGARYEHEPLEDGDSLELGEVRLTALATPGHRPEHLAYLVSDTSREEAPWLVLGGDSLFVSDVARPDLAVEPVEGAGQLFRSLRRLLELEDYTELWPGHVGGSLCGGAGMSRKPGSTIGFERQTNALLRAEEGDFVRRLTSQLQPQPPNFERIVELNRGPLLDEPVRPAALAPTAVDELLRAGAVVLDGRHPREFDAAHVPGSLNVTTTQPGVGTRAAWVVEPERPIVLVAGPRGPERFATLLEAVGLHSLRGYLDGGVAAWESAGSETWSTPAIDPAELARRLHEGSVALVDVRERDEWDDGHVEGSSHVPYHELRDDPELPRDRPLAVACSAGNRSSLAASLLRRAGYDGVIHVAEGGIEDLPDHGVELDG